MARTLLTNLPPFRGGLRSKYEADADPGARNNRRGNHPWNVDTGYVIGAVRQRVPARTRKKTCNGDVESWRTGRRHCRQPVFFIVFQALMALCLSIRRWVIGTGGLGGFQL